MPSTGLCSQGTTAGACPIPHTFLFLRPPNLSFLQFMKARPELLWRHSYPRAALRHFHQQPACSQDLQCKLQGSDSRVWIKISTGAAQWQPAGPTGVLSLPSPRPKRPGGSQPWPWHQGWPTSWHHSHLQAQRPQTRCTILWLLVCLAAVQTAARQTRSHKMVQRVCGRWAWRWL